MSPAAISIIMVGSLSLALLRIAGLRAQWFQAVAHLWVGGLVAVACVEPGEPREVCGPVAGILTFIEACCFLLMARPKMFKRVFYVTGFNADFGSSTARTVSLVEAQPDPKPFPDWAPSRLRLTVTDPAELAKYVLAQPVEIDLTPGNSS